MHHVIKLKDGGNNFLAELHDYKNPQWQPRERAKQFATAADARRYLAVLHACGLDYPGYLVRIRTAEDLRQERMQLRTSLEWALRIIDHELPPFPDATGDDGEAASQHYFASNMRAARALLHKSVANPRKDSERNE